MQGIECRIGAFLIQRIRPELNGILANNPMAMAFNGLGIFCPGHRGNIPLVRCSSHQDGRFHVWFPWVMSCHSNMAKSPGVGSGNLCLRNRQAFTKPTFHRDAAFPGKVGTHQI